MARARIVRITGMVGSYLTDYLSTQYALGNPWPSGGEVHQVAQGAG